jgi:SAM-dependent methyltransferase
MGAPLVVPEHEASLPPHWSELLLWAALAACPSILMVADTSFLTTNIAPIPMIWVAPLALYLLSFILSYERRSWYQRKVYLPLLVLGLGALAYLPSLSMNALPIYLSMAINLSAFFVACMVCHGELARMQPHPGHLTGYYLMLAVGGVVGGFFVGVIAPYWFDSNYELSIGLVLTGLVAAFAVIPKISFTTPRRRNLAIMTSVVLLVGLTWFRAVDHLDETSGSDVTVRNFYGTLQVYTNEEGGYRSMYHGQIVHGRQFTAPDKLDQPTAYYSPEGGVGRALQIKGADGPLRVGVIGLGVGTLVSYGRKADYYRLYEIDPLVIDIAKQNFSFLSRTQATTEIVLGDARLQLERETDQRFDVLVVDAFSGDSVPIHLLTREAFEQYFRHLKPNGVLAVHITNRFLDLRPVVKTAANEFKRDIRMVDFEGDSTKLVLRSRWALISSDAAFFQNSQLADATKLVTPAQFRPWKDDYSSIFSVLE